MTHISVVQVNKGIDSFGSIVNENEGHADRDHSQENQST